MRDSRQRIEPTTEWMVQDIVLRCREVLWTLEETSTSTSHLGNAAMMLRGAADDLVSLVELLEGGTSIGKEPVERTHQPFGLSFGMDQPAPDA